MRLKLWRGTWCAVWLKNGATCRASLHTTDRALAEQRFADLQRQSALPTDTIASIYAAYYADKGTERAGWSWKQLATTFGSLRPDQVTRATCRDYRARRRVAGAGDGTVLTELGYLRSALRWHDKHTPAQFEMPPKPAPRDASITSAEFARLLRKAETPHIRLFAILAIGTAGRMSAILQLTWSQGIDFDRGLIRLGNGERRRKGRATVPMLPFVRTALLEAYERRSCGHVIEFGGEPVKRVYRAFVRTAAAAGIPGCTPHVLRHTAAVWMAEGGTDMQRIAQYLGHTDSRVTERVYARFSPSYLQDGARALEENVSGSNEPVEPVRSRA